MNPDRRKWVLPATSAETVENLARALGVAPAVARVLVNRGLVEPGEARRFLAPSRQDLHSPWLMDGMERAVSRIRQTLERGEKIAVHGDYDADGITATVILVETLRALGGQVEFYLPSRFLEGYGLHREIIEEMAGAGCSLLITVDCGINAVEEVAYAARLGLEAIVTDHHRPLDTLPAAVAVLNPWREGCAYPFKELSGAGIAFKLAQALREKSGGDFPADLLDLAALGTVADVVPLLGENRALVSLGLAEANRRQRTGLNALAEAASLPAGQLNAASLAYILAPSINAAGRMGSAEPAVRLLLERDAARAEELAVFLRRENQERRETEQRILEEAEEMISRSPEKAGEKVLTLAREGWHHGVIGIVASRLVERYYRPVVLIALEGETGRGSARSIPGFDITAALAAGAPLLERFGGHSQAAGLTVSSGRVDELRRHLDRCAACLTDDDLRPQLELEGELEAAQIGLELAEQLALLEPFGEGNPFPLFCSRSWTVCSWRLVGQEGRHLKLSLRKGGCTLEPIFFAGSHLEEQLQAGRRVDLAFSLTRGCYQDRPLLNVELKDIYYSDCAADGPVEVIDRRGVGGRLYYIRELIRRGKSPPVIFAATRARAEKLQQQLAAAGEVYFISGGGHNSANNMPAECRDLLLYDLPMHERALSAFKGAAGQTRLHLLYDERCRQINRELASLALPAREALAEIYRALAEAAAGTGLRCGAAPEEVPETVPKKYGINFWRRARQIFLETGALQEQGGSLAPGPAAERWPERLEESPAYREARRLEEECQAFQDKLLTAGAAELAGWWRSYLSIKQ